jgi:O-antigen/teichoic acid export membrane protein
LSYVPDFVVRPGLFLAAMALLVPLGLHGNSHAILFAFVAGVWAVGLGQAWLMGPDRLRLRDFALSRRRFSRLLLPRTLSLLVVSITSFAFADIVMLLAGLLLRPDDAAVAGVAIRLAAIAGFILQAAQLFVLPDFTEAMTRRDMVQVNAVLWRMNALTLAVVLAGLVGAVLLGRFALSFFGPFYADGAGLLMLFMVGQSIRALGGMNQNLLAVAGHQIRTARACALALLVLGAVSSLLCARFGPIGLGYGVVAAELTWLLALAAQAQSLCGRRADLLWLTRNA